MGRRVVQWTLIAVLGLSAGIVAWESVPERLSITADNMTPRSALREYLNSGKIASINVAFATPDGRLYGIQDHFVFISDDGGKTFVRRGQLPPAHVGFLAGVKDAIARLKITRWIRRNEGPENLVVLNSGTILVFWDRIYRSTDDGASFQVSYDRPLNGILAPFGNNEGVAAGPDAVYFGEYSALPRPHAIRILEGTNDGRDWRVAYTFPFGDIFHVHSIAYDRYRNRYWVCTGDNDEESRILYSDDGFKSLHLLGGGSQAWRAVSLMITEKSLFWGSDNDRTAAKIYRWDFDRGMLKELQEIGKPSYSSTVMQDGVLILSTVYEPESPYSLQVHPEEATDLWISRDGTCWARILSLPYRHGTTSIGKPTRASISFPAGSPVGELFFTPQSTTIGDFDTSVLKIDVASLPACKAP